MVCGSWFYMICYARIYSVLSSERDEELNTGVFEWLSFGESLCDSC